MKLLLTMNLPYTRVHGGTNRSNRCLAEGLAARGHAVRVVVPALATPSAITYEQFLRELSGDGVNVVERDGTAVFVLNGVEVHAVADPTRLRARLVEQLNSFGPDWALVSAEDPSQNLLDAALKTCPSKVVYLAHTPQMFPFGPDSLYPGRARTELVGRAAAIVTISQFVADYIKRWAGFECFVNHPPHFGAGPFPHSARFDQGSVLLMNACAVKGISIFLALARAMPDVQFSALAGYGTTGTERAELEALGNVTILKNRRDLDDIFSETRVLLMPTLWIEGFGMAVVDAMLRGIPVLASRYGGLVEAKLGTDYLLPVRPIERFNDQLDTNMLPVPEVPEQEIAPWLEALGGLLKDRELYEQQSAAARGASHEFVSTLSVAPLEEFLNNLAAKGGARKTREAVRSDAAPAARRVADLTPEQRALFIMRMRKMSSDTNAGRNRPAAIERAPRTSELPLSFSQQRLWFLDQLEPGNPFYNLPIALNLRGLLNVEALERTLTEIVRRHEVLRTTFAEVVDKPVQVIHDAAPLPLPLTDISTLTTVERRESEARHIVNEEAHRPFDLSSETLLRARLVKLGEQEHVLLLVIHHIVSDGWSTNILVREATALYDAFSAGHPSPLAELPIQYADFAAWQRRRLSGELLDEKLSYWKQHLAGAPPVLELPTDRPRPSVQSRRGAIERFALDEGLSRALKALSRAEDMTLFMTLLAGFKVLLSRFSGQTDLVVGTPIAGREQLETEGLVGFFINALALRTNMAGDPTFRELLRRVREVTLGAYAHQEVPFDLVVEELQPERTLSHSPIFQVAFAMQSLQAEPPKTSQLSITPIVSEQETVQFDLIMNVREGAEGILGSLQYSRDLFDNASIAPLIENFKTLLAVVAAEPDARLSKVCEVLAESDRQRRLKREQELTEARLQKFKNVRRRSAPESLMKEKPPVVASHLAVQPEL
ncbi:MAG TPA: condensation domain-containing protein [Pyrinomonadaceae bacterium]